VGGAGGEGGEDEDYEDRAISNVAAIKADAPRARAAVEVRETNRNPSRILVD